MFGPEVQGYHRRIRLASIAERGFAGRGSICRPSLRTLGRDGPLSTPNVAIRPPGPTPAGIWAFGGLCGTMETSFRGPRTPDVSGGRRLMTIAKTLVRVAETDATFARA